MRSFCFRNNYSQIRHRRSVAKATLFYSAIALWCGTYAPHSAQAEEGALRSEPRIFYSTDEFRVTEFDLAMYLRNTPTADGEKWGSRARVLQALSDLYVLRILEGDAVEGGVLPEEEARWVASYAVALEAATRWIAERVDTMMASTNWEQEAREQYLARRDQYRSPETVTVQTFLIRTDDRSEAEALALAESLVTPSMSEEQFSLVVAEYTEDEVAKKDGGLIENLKRGRTVPPFEEAAFALNEPGEISPPTVSRYGVHVIRLISKAQEFQLPFEDVKEQIVMSLQATRREEYRAAVQEEARARMPSGYLEHTDELDSLMLETSTGPLRDIPEE